MSIPSVLANPNPHALSAAQNDNEVFEVMHPPIPTFDPYHDRPTSTTKRATRASVHREGLWHSSVHIWIVDPARRCVREETNERSNALSGGRGCVLLQKRSMKKDTFPGRWDISSAGHVEFGKGIFETARLELAEELGIELPGDNADVDDSSEVGKHAEKPRSTTELRYAFTIPAKQSHLGGCNAFEHVFFLVQSHMLDEQISLGTEEVTGVKWILVDDLVNALRSGDDRYAPRTSVYVSIMEKELNLICEGV